MNRLVELAVVILTFTAIVSVLTVILVLINPEPIL